MFCIKCGHKALDSENFCRKCGNNLKQNTEKSDTKNTNIPWHRNFKGWHIIIISFVSLFLFYVTDATIFDWIFLIGLIFGIVQTIKDYNQKKTNKTTL